MAGWLVQPFAFGSVESEQLGVAREVVGPMTGEAALAFGAKGTTEKGCDPAATCRALIGNFMGPERQQPHQLRFACGGAQWDAG